MAQALLGNGRPAAARIARFTAVWVIWTLYAFSSMGLAPATAFWAALAAVSPEIRWPARAASASLDLQGIGATAPRQMRAERHVSPSISRATEASASGQSCDSF